MAGNVDMDNSGGGNTNGPGSSYNSLATFATTSSVTSVSFISTPSLTSRVSLLSPSKKSTGDILGHVDNGLWWAGVGCAICCYGRDYGG